MNVARHLEVVAIIGGLLVVASCSNGDDTNSYRTGAADYITDTNGAVATQTGLTFDQAHCDSPPNTKTGAVFTCSANGSDHQTYLFTLEVIDGDSFQVANYAIATPPPTTT